MIILEGKYINNFVLNFMGFFVFLFLKLVINWLKSGDEEWIVDNNWLRYKICIKIFGFE